MILIEPLEQQPRIWFAQRDSQLRKCHLDVLEAHQRLFVLWWLEKFVALIDREVRAVDYQLLLGLLQVTLEVVKSPD